MSSLPNGMKAPEHALQTSGDTDAVWTHGAPYDSYPQYQKLSQDIETDVCVIGAGIAGISTAYELINRGYSVVLVEGREVLSGETGRTSGHLSTPFDIGFTEIKKKHGEDGARLAAESHQWAIKHVGEVSKELQIDCEYRVLPGYQISQYEKGSKDHDDDMKEIQQEVDQCVKLGMNVRYQEGLAIKGWTGSIDQRDAAIFAEQGAFHATKYPLGILRHLSGCPRFSCYTKTRVVSVQEKSSVPLVGTKHVEISTLDGRTIKAKFAVEATCAPLQKLAVVAQMEWNRTYCIAVRVPKGSVEDCLIYDSAETYNYARLTGCNERDDYLIVGGMDHAVGQDQTTGRFEELEKWTRERFTQAGTVDYKWSGQVFESMDHLAFIGKNQGNSNIYVITGDSGNGLTHGVLAAKIIADEIMEVPSPWAALYSPHRKSSMVKSITSTLSHVVQVNTQYKRFLQSDIKDIEDLIPGEGGVLNSGLSKPIAVYKDENGQVIKMSAICPHLKGVVCWNSVEKSWDCPIHGSRFSKEGIAVCGPTKAGLQPVDEAGEAVQQVAVGA